jgi:outer membrane cobalamin receptor
MEEFFNKHIIKFTLIVTAPLWIAYAMASDIEEVIVVGQQEKVVETNPATDTNILNAIIPAFTYNAGGYGGSAFYNERGAQTVHTAVFRNGIPANEPGGSWYNFGHDIASSEKVKVISGANGVMYGSGAMAGTVLIEDTITRGLTMRNIVDSGIENQFIKLSSNNLEVASFKDTIASARNDNDEEDTYEQQSAKIIIDAMDFEVIAKFVDYEYDYDNCYDYNWGQSNYTSGEYFTVEDPTYANESYRDFVRFGNNLDLSNKLNVAFGVDGERNIYNTESTNSMGATENKYEDENFGAYLNVNAEFALNYNFGLRFGNDDQNAMRFGLSKGEFFFNIGNSFRKANLYERFGDAWVDGNEDLMPEEGVGYEIGFGAISVFKYDFEETIEYQSSYTTTVIITPAVTTTDPDTGEVTTTPAVTEDIFTNATYANGGEYSTQGFRFANNYGPFGVMLSYTDTEQPRVPKYMGAITYQQVFNGFTVAGRYAVNLERAPGQYDFLPEGEDYLEDLNRLDLSASKTWGKYNLTFKLNNALDDVVEVLPGYDNRGREVLITLQYNW